ERQGLRDGSDVLPKRAVTILGVSFDTPADNARFVATERFPFRLLSDSDRTLAVAVGAADSTGTPVARRISYLVGPDGRVEKVYGAVNPSTHASGVLPDLPSQ